MDVSSLKSQLHQLIEATDDEQLLADLFEKIKQTKSKQDWWDTLHADQKQRILQSEEQYKRGEVVSNEIVLKKIQQWLQK